MWIEFGIILVCGLATGYILAATKEKGGGAQSAKTPDKDPRDND